MTGSDHAVNQAVAALLAATTARDHARHVAALTETRDAAQRAVADCQATLTDLTASIRAAKSVKAMTDARSAAGEVADLEAEKAAADSPREKRLVQVQLDAALTILAEADTHAAPYTEQVTQLQAEQAGARARVADLAHILAAAQAALDNPSRPPVSDATLHLTALWYSDYSGVRGLPELTDAEEGERYSVVMSAYHRLYAIASIPRPPAQLVAG